jgi:hypothetical protein
LGPALEVQVRPPVHLTLADLLDRLGVRRQLARRPGTPPPLEFLRPEDPRLLSRLEQIDVVGLALTDAERPDREVGVLGREDARLGDGAVKRRSRNLALDDVGPLDTRVLEDGRMSASARARAGQLSICPARVQQGRRTWCGRWNGAENGSFGAAGSTDSISLADSMLSGSSSSGELEYGRREGSRWAAADAVGLDSRSDLSEACSETGRRGMTTGRSSLTARRVAGGKRRDGCER